ncbi:MAG TPA: hypothetical protein VM074_04870 [Solimonas sp.]|nr:hypothetical protein [Solimonas sp.]
MKKIDKSRREPVRSSLMASALLASLAAFGYRMEWLPAGIIEGLGALVRWLGHPVGVPLWLLAAMATCTSFFALAVVARLLAARISQPGWRDYRSDSLMGLRWQWTYNKANAIANLGSFCPGCEHPVQAEPGPQAHSTAFCCSLCNETRVVPDHHPEELKAAVVQMIEQKLQLHTWPGSPALDPFEPAASEARGR